MATGARVRLLKAAEELFHSEGIRATGVETLLARSGVGRASFYRHFASKDDLVEQTVRDSGARWRRWLADEVAARGGDPLTVFDALADRQDAEGVRGCTAITAMIEAADADSPVHQAGADHKRSVVDYLDGVLSAAGHTEHATLAEQLVLLLDGAMVTSLRAGGRATFQQARAMAEILLRTSGQRPVPITS